MCNTDNINKNNEDQQQSSSSTDYIPTTASTTEVEVVTKPTTTVDDVRSFCIISFFMFLFFGIHNYLQEAIINVPGFKYGVMLGFMEVVGVTVCSAFERSCIRKEKGRVAPIKAYPLLTLCLLSSSALSNLSLNYINFPTKVVFRSCKLLPTMLFSTCINRRTFSSLEYVSAIFVCTGLILFAAADWRLTPTFNPIGLIMVLLSVVADAVLPNLQEKLFRNGSSRLEVTVFTNFFTLIAMAWTTFLSGDLTGIMYAASQDRTLAIYMVIYTSVSYIAISTFMVIVKRYGAVTGVLLATARKAMTLILSFIFFPKTFSWCYVFGSVLVLGGLMFSSLLKQKEQIYSMIDSIFYNNSRKNGTGMDLECASTIILEEKKKLIFKGGQ